MPENLFKKMYNLPQLSPDCAKTLFSRMKRINVKRDTAVLSEGHSCRHIYFIESGCLRSVMYKETKEINLSFFLENNFVTNIKSLRSDQPSEYEIKACEPSILWRLGKNDMFELYELSSEINSFGKILLEQLLIAQEEHMHFLKVNSPSERYAYLLKNTPELLQRVSLTQLSSYLGMSRESLSRIRKIK